MGAKVYIYGVALRQEEVAREIISREKITEGPVAMMSAVEPCRTWVARGNRQTKQLELKLVSGKCEREGAALLGRRYVESYQGGSSERCGSEPRECG